EDAHVDESVSIRIELAVFYGLGFGCLNVAPVADRLGRGDLDLDLRELPGLFSHTRPFTECGVPNLIAHQCRPDSSKMLTGLSSASRTLTSRPSEWSYLTSNLNDSGMMGSSTSLPLTMAS